MRKFGLLVDWRLLLPAVVLVILGLTTLSSIHDSFFRSQLNAFLLSVIAFVVFSQITLESFKGFHLPIYIASILLLVIVFFFGFESHGAARWITVFGVSLQFSEILKPILLVALASYLSQQSNKSFRAYLFLLFALVPIAFLIYKQPDLGNAFIYGAVTVLSLVIFGFPFFWFGLTLLPFIILSPFIWNMLHEYQRQRLLTFIHPSQDPLGTSYNSIQAIIAVGSGMWLGKGLSESTQSGLRFLPERHTDFMFATFTEEFGFIGSIVILLCFAFLGYRLYRIFSRTDDLFGKVFTAGALSLLLIQFFLNIGMNIGIVPVVGVILPFLSFGGSSLLSNFILLGMVSSIGKSIKKRGVLEIR